MFPSRLSRWMQNRARAVARRATPPCPSVTLGVVSQDLSYDAEGATCVAEAVWTTRPRGYRSFEQTAPIGHGEGDWTVASREVLHWAVKTRSGFSVRTADGED